MTAQTATAQAAQQQSANNQTDSQNNSRKNTTSMLASFAQKLFGSSNDRALRGLRKYVEAINEFEPQMEALSDDDLRAQTDKLKKRLADGETLNQILPEAFATVREASKRTLGLRPFDVQLMGGIVLHQGKISEMRTGEGKTLVATLPVYLNALTGKGVHVVTVNDYLAKRDAEWMSPIYNFLGLSVGFIVGNLPDEERRKAYASDITYGTNNEFGFDYLRDNMKFRIEDMVQREFNYAIVDEVDSILIDEARTPLIISGALQDSAEMYKSVDKVIPHLVEQDYEIDEKLKTILLTEAGNEHVEELLKEHGLLTEGYLYDALNIGLVHHVNQALRAHKLFSNDKDYIVKDGQVIIIDEFTGRMMEGRRFSEGLHQALEAKEGVSIQSENQILASITFQNYFRLYPKLAGMTGTAMTEAAEFESIYNLQVVDIPTNVQQQRLDMDDEIYRTAEEKYEAVVQLIHECREKQQPVLVGTTSIEKSELLARYLTKAKIPHNVLNARYHEQEAHIIAQAGAPGAVTIATNMAGRGTDIKLGGNVEMRLEQEIPADATEEQIKEATARIEAEAEEARQIVQEAGGLYVIGTERHESRRIDNQLRGRSGRQGDPGATKFFISLEDDLMRIFGSEMMDNFLKKMGLQRGQPIMHSWINAAIERAQKKVEAQYFEVRKTLLKFDNVMNDQRKVIYEQRREMMEAEDLGDVITDMRHDVIHDLVSQYIPNNAYPEQWDTSAIHTECHRILGLVLPVEDWAKEENITEEDIINRVIKAADDKMAEKERAFTAPIMRQIEKSMVLQILDQVWKEHLLNMEYLRQAIVLRVYGQKDPLNEYKTEAFSMFEGMISLLKEKVTNAMSVIELHPDSMPPADLIEAQAARQKPQHTVLSHGPSPLQKPQQPSGMPVTNPASQGAADPANWEKTPRNAPCPCGSGKKYKHCHGKAN